MQQYARTEYAQKTVTLFIRLAVRMYVRREVLTNLQVRPVPVGPLAQDGLPQRNPVPLQQETLVQAGVLRGKIHPMSQRGRESIFFKSDLDPWLNDGDGVVLQVVEEVDVPHPALGTEVLAGKLLQTTRERETIRSDHLNMDASRRNIPRSGQRT